jgi:gliding motility-associated lipoprotein GldB
MKPMISRFNLLQILISSFLLFMFCSCNKKSKVEQSVKEIPVELAVTRFEQAFFDSEPTDLPKLKKQFPAFFPKNIPDSVWINKLKNPLWRELYTEVEKKYRNFDLQTQQIGSLFQHIKYYFPETQTPKIITLIYEMDYDTKTIYTDSIVLIPLEMYLGKNHKFYEFPDYQKQTLEPKQILPDLVSSFAQTKMGVSKNKILLAMMIDAGKELYLKDLLLPEYTDADKIGYTPQQITFCTENESYIWTFFVQNNLLYSNDSKLANRFINPAPFSKFYLEIDNETPGKIGTWMGWQIVKSFMMNNDVKPEKMFEMSAEDIFNQSKYKPKKA